MTTVALLSIGFLAGFLVAAIFQAGAVADGWQESARTRAELERMWRSAP